MRWQKGRNLLTNEILWVRGAPKAANVAYCELHRRFCLHLAYETNQVSPNGTHYFTVKEVVELENEFQDEPPREVILDCTDTSRLDLLRVKQWLKANP